MNAGHAQLRHAIKVAAAEAARKEPTDVGARARIFAAALSGAIEFDDHQLATIVWGVLARPAADSAPPSLTESASA